MTAAGRPPSSRQRSQLLQKGAAAGGLSGLLSLFVVIGTGTTGPCAHVDGIYLRFKLLECSGSSAVRLLLSHTV